MFCSTCGAAVNPGVAFCPACGSRMPAGAAPAQPFSTAPPPPGAYAPAMDYASWGNRAVGYIIDSVLVGVVMVALYAILAGAFIGSPAAWAATPWAARSAASSSFCFPFPRSWSACITGSTW